MTMNAYCQIAIAIIDEYLSIHFQKHIRLFDVFFVFREVIYFLFVSLS